ncbi:NAD-dependent succinate-semialdehyde dehydrogenase [Dysgonomonas capnocytophagoides]|uniref:NAD-dependent succinate-semialdehyde dehydrogenase n=1 Tax=Dysgonomonas capnocytophagoides TaxID=45254 RepID=A0A4Y8L305_9BACT|nr:NAD-dependent succinate-semialdehyde dehydrogenase [Dysgonomonas capnocytophagoides]TFD95408.1 NAD-dependent succinate-semialdehyde dehydrogenase [Dysgonomonas capnocytophagoides]
MSSIKTVNPATNQVEKEYSVMTDQQIDLILSDADKAFQSWKKTSFAERAKLLHKVASILRERKEELGKLCSIEMGKLHREGIGEVELSANIFDYYADNGEKFLADAPLDTPQGKAFLSYEPIGVLLSVQPWNFPFYQITRSAAPNIMAGNTVVLKHASNVPQAAEIMEKIFAEAGAPKGVYTNLFVPGAKVSELVADPRVKGASLTGSEPAGSSFASMAGKYLKKSTLELGGSDAFVVLEDADLDKAVETAAFGRLWNAGQVCVSPKRIIVMASVADKFIEKAKAIYDKVVVGDPLDPKTQLAPLSSEKAVQDVIKQVETTVQQGAKLVRGGKRIDRPGAYMEPTILTDIKKGMLAYSDEIFGPVLAIYAAKNVDEAVELANDTNFGLGGTVFGTDTDKAVEVARRIDTGMVYINHVTGIAPELPFGGTKRSGYGREQSPAGIYEFVNAKLIRVTTPDAAY